MPNDPFDILGLEPRFGLAEDQIERAYLTRIASAHPDRADDAPDLGRSADLNEARRTLLNPERRAAALLARLGGPDAAEDKSLPDGFLMEIMETRNEIEQELADDPSPRTRAKWQARAEQQRRQYADRVSALFDRAAPEPGNDPDPAALREIRTMLNAWRYIERLIEQLDHDPARADFGP